MSKKESEFDRYDRMKRMEKEQEIQKKKYSDFPEEAKAKKGGKQKPTDGGGRRSWSKELDEAEEYDYA